MDKKNLTRVLTGTAMAVTFFLSIIYGGFPLFVLLLIIIFFATKEYVSILKNKGFHPSIGVICFADALLALLAYFNKFNFVAGAVTASMIIAFLWVLFKGKQPYIANVATTVLGFLYSGLCPLYVIFLRDLGGVPTYKYFIKMQTGYNGLLALTLLFFCVLITDTGCYFFGMKYGKHKLAPIISPNKTIEGSIGGTLCSVLMSFVIGSFIGIAWYHCLIIGLLIAFFAQVGDLCESLIKRDAGVKDSGNTLPGHGGFLDRTDSYVFTAPILYYYFQYIISSNIFETIFKGLT